MPLIDEKYRYRTDQYGLAVITMYGRCTHDKQEEVESDCTRKYDMVSIPNTSGAVLKSLDGTFPTIVEVEPTNMPAQRYRCVKVDGRVNPYAPQQTGGPYDGYYILAYEITYQEVGGVA